MPIQAPLQRCQALLPHLLKQYLPPPDAQSTVCEAMHYACLNGGKRLRPLLVYLSAEIFGTPWERLHPIATAIELIHCYSLVHDDLPAMDNDELRRGKPTCHKAFNEATAILAGDALLTLAFDILSTSAFLPTLSESVILKIIKIISKAAGLMVQGQALDIAFEGKAIKLEQLIQMHRAKTGALIAASVQCGALASGHVTEKDLVNLQNFGQAIGLSFQIQDDILDRLGHPNIMGKHPGQDVKKNKCTFVTLLGLAQAQDYAQNCHEQALACLTDFGKPADPLRALSEYFVERVK